MARPTRLSEEPTLRLTASKWEAWLASHHATATAALVVITKRDVEPATLSYAEALEVALAWGWIDGQKRALDAQAWLQRFTPRRAKSLWSKINCEKAEALVAAGKMQPAGLAEIERARQDGRWAAAYDSPRTSQVPDDLAAALAANRRAGAAFAELDGTNRYAILHRVQTAKRAETRAARIATFVDMLARGETLHPPRRARPTAVKPRGR
jgi:uncharacterized protein YdeI (YjbR/CyaY-like superfamily)